MAFGADSLFVEPYRTTLVRLEIPLKRLPEAFYGFTIAQLSDFHYDQFYSAGVVRRAIEIVNGLQPDLIVLTGDFMTVSFVEWHLHHRTLPVPEVEACAKDLATLRSKYGILSVLGNHDIVANRGKITDTLQGHGIPVLRNRAVPIEKDGARIWIAGIDDILEGRPDIEAMLHGVPPSETVVSLVHEPDFADMIAAYPVDLQLSGHSHGGQIWLPVIGAPWLPDLAEKYPRGLRQIRGLMLYTNMGLGTIRVPVRFHCPPEITLITLMTAKI